MHQQGGGRAVHRPQMMTCDVLRRTEMNGSPREADDMRQMPARIDALCDQTAVCLLRLEADYDPMTRGRCLAPSPVHLH